MGFRELFKIFNKLAQASVEFVFIAGFAFVVLSGTTYYFSSYYSDMGDDISSNRANQVGEALLVVAKDVSHGSGYSKKVVHLDSPESLKGISTEREHLVLNISTARGYEQVLLDSEQRVSSQVVPSEIAGGTFTIERMKDVIMICSGTECNCTETETGPSACRDGIDNNCDGFMDIDDCECASEYGGTDNDLDGYYTIYCDGNYPDCLDTEVPGNAIVYPGSPEVCDFYYSVSYSCVGVKVDDVRCGDDGVIDCDGNNFYYKTGVDSEIGTEDCNYRNYEDITSNRCEGLGDCKDENSGDCVDYSDSVQTSAGVCEYLTDCTGTTSGIVEDYLAGTKTTLCEECDGSGNEIDADDDDECGTIDCDGNDEYSLTSANSPEGSNSCNFRDFDDLDGTNADRCEGAGDCKDPNSTDCDVYSDSIVENAGVCERILGCTDKTGPTLDDYSAGTKTTTCKECDGSGSERVAADDNECGIIECDGNNYYSLSGSNTPTGTSTCTYRDYEDLDGNNVDRCKSPGVCKDPDSADCTAYSDNTQATADVCNYMTGCSGTTSGTVQNYGSTTKTTTCKRCDGSGNEVNAVDDSACGTIDCDNLDTATLSGSNTVAGSSTCTYKNYNDITTNRCSGGSCKPANTVSTCTSYTSGTVSSNVCDYIQGCTPGSTPIRRNYASGTNHPNTCTVCDGSGGIRAPADDGACGTIDCDGRNYYYVWGAASPTGTNYRYLRNYNDITSNRCEGINNCKDANTADCTSYFAQLINSCGTCKYATTGGCANYGYGTSCGTNKICNGAGSCIDNCVPLTYVQACGRSPGAGGLEGDPCNTMVSDGCGGWHQCYSCQHHRDCINNVCGPYQGK